MQNNTQHYISSSQHEHLQDSFELIDQMLSEDRFEEVTILLKDLHYADLALYIDNASYKNQKTVVVLLNKDLEAETLVCLSASAKKTLLDCLTITDLAFFINQLGTEDIIELIDDFDDEIKDAILDNLPLDKKRQIIEGFTYPENTVGRVMEPDFVALQDSWTIKHAIDIINRRNTTKPFHATIIVNNNQRPVGYLMLCDLLRHPLDTKLQAIMDEEFKIAYTHTELDELSYTFKQYALTIVPVTNKAGKLVGTVSIDNMIYIMERQAEGEIMHFAGIYSQDIFENVINTAKHRFPWLFVNLITACLTAVIIDNFSETILQFVTLAAIMPIAASMGGNAGMQTMTVTVRALYNKDISHANSFRVIIKELLVCGFNGVFLACIGGTILLALFRDLQLSTIFGAAVIINFLVAGLCGAFIPITLDRLDIDPAAASGVFLTALTDSFGFLTILTLAYLFLV